MGFPLTLVYWDPLVKHSWWFVEDIPEGNLQRETAGQLLLWKQSDTTLNSDTTEIRTSSDCSGQYSYLIHFQMASFTKVVILICLVTDMIGWKQKLKTQWVKIEIDCVQPGRPGNFFRLVFFPFQYSSERTGGGGGVLFKCLWLTILKLCKWILLFGYSENYIFIWSFNQLARWFTSPCI